MLQSFRGMLKGWGKYILLAIVILAFAVVGTQTPNNFGRGSVVSVGGTSFGLSDLDREFAQRIDDYRVQTGQALSQEEAISLGLLEQAINNLRGRGLFIEESKLLGIVVTEEMVQDAIQEVIESNRASAPAFADYTDLQIFNLILQQNRFSTSEFEELVRLNLLQNQLGQGVSAAVTAPRLAAELLTLRQTEERGTRIARLPVPEPAEPTDDELASFYATNAELFETPEQRVYTLLTLDRDSLADQLVIDDETLQQAFAAEAVRRARPELRSFQQAQFPTIEIAQAVLNDINSGTDFTAAVRTAGSSAISFEEQPQAVLADDTVAAAVFAADGPGIVGPVEGVFGIVIAEVQSITPAVEVAFEDIVDELRDQQTAEVYAFLVDDLRERIQESGDAGLSLADAALEADIQVRQVGPIDLNQLTEAGATETDLPPGVQQLAFSLAPGEFFRDIDLDDGGTAFVEVNEVIPATLPPLEEMRDAALSAYDEQAREIAAGDMAVQFRTLIDSGLSFDVAALTLGGRTETRYLSTLTRLIDMPTDLQTELFEADAGTLLDAISNDGEAIVTQVDEIRFGPNQSYDQQVTSVLATLGSILSNEHFDAYLTAAEEDLPVTEDRRAIEARFALTQ